MEAYTTYKTAEGYTFSVEKQSIKTSFACYYGFCGVSREEEHEDAVDEARRLLTKEDYFIEKNMEYYNWLEDEVKEADILRDKGYRNGEVLPCTQLYIDYYMPCWRESIVCRLSEEDKSGMIKAIEDAKEKHLKRLKTYLKRFGLSKVDAYTWLVD